ncbi:hypothetical protein BON22_5401 [Cyberlindnera fabianii]|uniref:Alpha-1,3-mannosyltransferase MNN1 n=1 Tax=Cyberlindnera fabianii TaxID=36022 RepID=A0A1V2KYV0_CYBFA|nr:hypothetical protein BON22_5401 [Cyberlindnera fabianii]
MALANQINAVLRHAQAIGHSVQNFSPNKRFINLNVFIAVLLLVILTQHYFLKTVGPASETIVMLKSDAHHSNYDTILKSRKPDQFRSLSFGQRCDQFFEAMHSGSPNWKFDNFDTEGYEDDYVNFQDFIKWKHEQEPDKKFDEKTIEALEKEFQEKNYGTIKVDQRINDAMATLRIFGKCYLEDQTAGSSKFGFGSNIFNDNSGSEGNSALPSPDRCSDLEARLFPWLSSMLPIYTRWDGSQSNGLPDLKSFALGDYDEYDSPSSSKDKKEKRAASDPNCFLTSFKKRINGRGYVISASDGQVDELMKLALVLRANGNTLPIQIVHKGDLSKENMDKLIKEFRRPISNGGLPPSYQNLVRESSLSFPKQEVWFVNVRPCIKEGFGSYFQKYANKLLAYMFNSFDEMLLIDTDTVPFVNLEEIFKYPDYVSKGAYFFQDRQLKGQNSPSAVEYFKRLLPSKLDHFFFDIPLTTDFTLNNRFIGGRFNHYMESGVVAIKRSTHFTGMMAATQLNFWSTTAKKVHGDKELFWLGLSIAGNENYAFNNLAAASIGELTKPANRRFPNSGAQELCSNHPGHVNGYNNQTLLWINSGFTFCKNTQAAEFDAGKPLFKGYSKQDLASYYRQKTLIRAAIVPPPQEVKGANQAGNPDMGWSDEHKYCMSYTWCAVDFIGYDEKPEEKGLLVTFDDDQTKWFDFIGDVWMDGIEEESNN